MREENELSAAHRELVGALKSLPAAGVRVDPVAAAFAAGRRSAQPNVRLWKAAALVALVVGVGSHLVTKPPQNTTPGDASPGIILATYRPAPVSDQSVVALQQAMQERGLNGLPAAHMPAARAVRAKDFF